MVRMPAMQCVSCEIEGGVMECVRAIGFAVAMLLWFSYHDTRSGVMDRVVS